MSNYERGPLLTFEITWNSGHVERIKAHQVTHHGGSTFFTSTERPRINFHGEIDGHWRLVLSLLEEDIRTVREVSTEDAFTGDDE